MVVAMRLMRMGTIHRPVYRISVGDSRKAPTAKFIEHIGTYDPHHDKLGMKQLRLNVARAKYWIAMGCQPSPVVARLLSRFHLLPVPPQRGNLAVVDPLVFKAMAGQDIRPELVASTYHAPNVTVDGVLVHHAQPGMNRRQKELTPERIAQIKKQCPWKLQSFPFEYQPTEKTMAAWNQARLHHHRWDESVDGVIGKNGLAIRPDQSEPPQEDVDEDEEEDEEDVNEENTVDAAPTLPKLKAESQINAQVDDLETVESSSIAVDENISTEELEEDSKKPVA